jgi:hypothetical protein
LLTKWIFIRQRSSCSIMSHKFYLPIQYMGDVYLKEKFIIKFPTHHLVDVPSSSVYLFLRTHKMKYFFKSYLKPESEVWWICGFLLGFINTNMIIFLNLTLFCVVVNVWAWINSSIQTCPNSPTNLWCCVVVSDVGTIYF